MCQCKPKILFNGSIIRVKIMPSVLENSYEQTFRRSIKESKPNSKKSLNVFRNQPRKLIFKLAQSYGIKPKIVIKEYENLPNQNRFMMSVEFSELGIEVFVFCPSKRSGWRQLAPKVHRQYEKKIIYE